MAEAVEDWSLRTWQDRHRAGYFPRSVEHAEWKIYTEMPPWFLQHARPTKADSVVEVGCGYGEWMIPLAPHVGHVTGFDIHPSPVAMAIEKFAEHGVYNASVSLGQGTQIAYPDNTFSLVYSISVFQHLPRPMVAAYLRETARVLRLGGRCLHHFRNMDNVGPYPRPADDIVVNHTGDFSCGWTVAEVEQAAAAAGLHNAQVTDIGLFLLLHAVR